MPSPARLPKSSGGSSATEAKNRHKTKVSKHSFIRTLSLLRYDKIRMVSAMILCIFVSFSNSIMLLLQRPVYNRLAAGAPWKDIAFYIIAMPVVVLITNCIAFGVNMLVLRGSQNIMFELRKKLCVKLQYLPIPYFDQKSHGDLMSTFTNDMDRLTEFFGNTWSNVASALIEILVFGVMLAFLSWQMMLVLLLFLVLPIYLSKTIAQKSTRFFVAQQTDLAEMNGFIEEHIEGQKVVRAYTHEKEAVEGFCRANKQLMYSGAKAQTCAMILMPLMGNLSYIQYAAMSILGGWLTLRGHLDLGALLTFLTVSRRFTQPIAGIANTFNSIAQAVAGSERIFEILDQEPEEDGGRICSDGKNWLIPHEDGHLEKRPIRGAIRMENVHFSYVPDKPVLRDISLHADPGERIALVGSTGAGKTTITNLINRFYDIDQGRIFYDGIDIREIKKADLRRAMGLVLQEIHLFKGSVKENIRFGRLDASDEEVIAAAKAAHAHHFICSLEKGYDTELQPDGANLSQGQRQLIAIARAAIAHPPVLILDEATSSIDTRTEKLIEKGMDHLIQGSTTFAIAHRLSTVRSSNAIMVLEQGEIIERGDHEALMARQGIYYSLNTGQRQLS